MPAGEHVKPESWGFVIPSRVIETDRTLDGPSATVSSARGWWVMLKACLRHDRAQEKDRNPDPPQAR
jgi:hypothetical protein